MNRVNIVGVALLIALTGCVTPQTYPNKRTLTEQNAQAIGKTNIVLSENLNGIEKSWFQKDSSQAGSQYGLLGALVSGVMDAIINSGPAKRAQKAANEMAELMPAEALNASLVKQLDSQIPATDATPRAVAVAGVSTVNKILKPDRVDDMLEISTSYTLSEDASTLRVIVWATYQTAKMKYVTPYTFSGSVPKSELTGPIYTNVFTYESPHLPVPTLTPQLEQRLIASIEASYQNESGVPPAVDSKEGKAMKKEVDAAKDGKLTKDEIAIFLTREWLKDGGALLKREVEGAHAFAARYIAQDLSSVTIPKFDGQDEVLETLPDQRTVRRIGAQTTSGSYVSSPGNLTSFTTYGNAVSISKKQTDSDKALRDQVRAEKMKTTKKR